MFVGVVVENFHKCRESQEQEEKARRAAVHARKIDRKRKRTLRYAIYHVRLVVNSGVIRLQ